MITCCQNSWLAKSYTQGVEEKEQIVIVSNCKLIIILQQKKKQQLQLVEKICRNNLHTQCKNNSILLDSDALLPPFIKEIKFLVAVVLDGGTTFTKYTRTKVQQQQHVAFETNEPHSHSHWEAKKKLEVSLAEISLSLSYKKFLSYVYDNNPESKDVKQNYDLSFLFKH